MLKCQTRSSSGMGISLLWLTLFGAVIGQIVTWVHFAVWVGWSGLGQVSELVHEGVRRAVQECLELEVTTTSTTTEPVPFIPSIHWYSASISIWVRFDFLVIIGCLTLTTSGLVLCGWWCCRSHKHEVATAEPLSPVAVELPIAQLARNQLAEIRLRKHVANR